MSSISCVIPTLWLPKETPELLDQLNNSNTVKDIIVIDNAYNNRTVDFTKYGNKEILPTINKYNKKIPVEKYGKFTVLIPSENIYVTEPWNLGVMLSKYNIVCILNDDVIPEERVFTLATKYTTKEVGLIGVNLASFYNTETTDQIVPITVRPVGFGFCMFVHKSKYVEIPSCIKVWYNDDYLFQKVKGKHYCFTGAKIKGTRSRTNHGSEIEHLLIPIRVEDELNYNRIIKNDKL